MTLEGFSQETVPARFSVRALTALEAVAGRELHETELVTLLREVVGRPPPSYVEVDGNRVDLTGWGRWVDGILKVTFALPIETRAEAWAVAGEE